MMISTAASRLGVTHNAGRRTCLVVCRRKPALPPQNTALIEPQLLPLDTEQDFKPYQTEDPGICISIEGYLAARLGAYSYLVMTQIVGS
jgi:hypothetical protein